MLDLTEAGLIARIEALRVGFAGYSNKLLARNRAYLRAFSPEFNADLGEHDQWAEAILPEDAGHTRSSYNLARPTAEMWAGLEASELPAVRWEEDFIPTPVPSMDATENADREEVYRSEKLVRRQRSTMREQVLLFHARRAKLRRHFYRGVLRKNVYGHSWLKSVPDVRRQTFTVLSKIDTSTVFPVWSGWNDRKLDAILVAYRKSARMAAAQYNRPGEKPVVALDRDGITVDSSSYYQPTPSQTTEADRSFVWVEDYWVLDEDYEQETSDGPPVRSRVVNCLRINGTIVTTTEYPGWATVPYFLLENENERDHTGFSDVATVMPFQDGINHFMSQQQDVIYGESRPKFKYRGDANRTITLEDEGVISLDPDEDIEQLRVHLDVFPTQIHGQQLQSLMQRATGLPAVAWGEIQAAQNSGRALATAWRATAIRMVPRTFGNEDTVSDIYIAWLDWMELYGWNHAPALYGGNRDFELKWPNQEPRDFQEVTLNAINKLQAGIHDLEAAMEATGEASPDEMIERVRADYMDTVLHPEKGQSYLLLTRLKNQIEIEAQQAGIAAATAQAQLSQLASSPPGGAPSGGSPEQQAGAADQARAQAAQGAAPTRGEGQNSGNKTTFGTLVQNGAPAQNRIIDQGTIGG